MKRIAVIGSSCSGKTTFSKRLSKALEIPHVELDALHWEANWKEAQLDVFKQRVSAALEQPAWIIEGGYERKIGTIVFTKVDTIIWLDPGLPTVLYRFFTRSIRRTITREELWNGCKENFKNSMYGKDALLWWILKYYRSKRAKFQERKEKAPEQKINFIHLRTKREVEAYFSTVRMPVR